MINLDSVRNQLMAAGFQVDGFLDTSGKVKRVKIDGMRQKGWYALHEFALREGRGIALGGSFGWWKGAEKFVERIRIELPDGDKPSREDNEAIKKRMAESRRLAEEQQARTQLDAAARAARVWREYKPGHGHSEYLNRKGVKDWGVKWSPDGRGTFAIPIRDNIGKLWGLQIIRDSNKQPAKLEKEYFPKGCAIKGHYHVIGTILGTVLIAEGYATAATLHEATRLPVVVAFHAGNLQPVAEAIRKAHKQAHIIVCADDDYLTDGNPGCKAAKDAALAVEGDWCKPIFATDRAGKKITDFNDLAHLEGPLAVQNVIAAIVARKQQSAPTPSLARGVLPPGGGEATERGSEMPSIISVEDAVSRWWGTYGLGGKVLFDEVERRLVHRDDVMNLLPERSWNDVKRHPLWRVARDTEIGFDPTEKDPQIKCNLFGGWPTEPRPGTCTKLLELLEWLCANEVNDGEVYRWILKWLAYPLQHRGAKMHSAIVVHGPQGTGKSRFFEAYGKIYREYFSVIGQDALEDKFNSDWAEKKLFVIGDEILARQDMYHTKNRLKGFITSEFIRVNPKNVAAHTERNQMNIVFLSNERQPLVLENDDRRHCVIWVPPKLDDAFFAAVNEEIDNGGVEAIHHYLLDLDLGDFRPWTRPPMTKAKQDLVDLGKSSEERFLHEWIAGELEGPDGDLLPCVPCLGSHLYKAYEAWCNRHGERTRGMKDLISLAGKQTGWQAGASMPTWTTLKDRQTKNRKMIVPAETAMTASPPDLARDRYSTKSEWLTACFFAFENVLGVQS